MQTKTGKVVHRITRVWQVLICFSILIALFLMLGTSWVIIEGLLIGVRTFEIPSILFLVFCVFLYGFAIFIGISGLKIYAVTSPLGLEYRGIGIHIHTSWENIAQIALVGIAARLGIGAEVIKLSESPQILSSNWLGKLIFGYQKGIPLLDFGKWRYSSLGSEIQKYAPKLLAR